MKALIDNIRLIVPFEDTDVRYEHFHVPGGQFISSPKTSAKVKSSFCKAWLEKTEEIIKQKPSALPFCKVVALIHTGDLWESQIIIFYDKDYYESFWKRDMQEQTWKLIEDRAISFANERNIKTTLNEKGYIETVSESDYYSKSALWFYGDV